MNSTIFKALKKVIHTVLNYSIFVIYQYNMDFIDDISIADGLELKVVSKEDIASSDEQQIAEQSWYSGTDTYTFACSEHGRIVGLCVYWYGVRYKSRNFWPLKDKEAKLVQLYTLSEMRGKGIAPLLIQYSSNTLKNEGFNRIFARVWHTNATSRKVFDKCDWNSIATVVEIQPIRQLKPLHFYFKK